MKIEYTVTIEEEIDVTPEESFATDDPELDRKLCEDIRRSLRNGDTWAWCMVTVTATVTIEGEMFKGRATLGACSYTSEEDFRQPGGYFDDMCDEAWHALIASVVAACNRGDVATRARPALEASKPARRKAPGA